MTLPSELRTALPSSIDPDAVRAAVRTSGSPSSFGGETWLLDLDGRLAVLGRASIFDALEPIALAEVARPVELRGSSELVVQRATAGEFVVRLSALELEAVEALLFAVEGVAVLDAALASMIEPAPTIDGSPPDFGAPRELSQAPADPSGPITLTDLEALETDRETEAAAALETGDYLRATTAATALVGEVPADERRAWTDLLELIALLGARDPAAAYLWTRGVREVPGAVHDALFRRLVGELERVDEPALAWAALDELHLDAKAPVKRAAIEARLDRDQPTLAREVAGRARELFEPLASDGDRLAQIGLAQALTDLDELAEALTWIREATAAKRDDFDARMLETRILSLRAIETEDDRELLAALQKVADDFPDRAEPLVDLADHVEYDDPPWAIDNLRKALAREQDDAIVSTLAELLESQGRLAEAIEAIEAALAWPDAVRIYEDELRAKLAKLRAALALGESSALTPGPAMELAEQKPPSSAAVLLVIIIVALATAALWLF